MEAHAEMFHIILLAKGKAGAQQGPSASSPRGRISGPFLEEAGPGSLPPPGSEGNTGIGGLRAALQPLPMDCPIRYSSSRKPHRGVRVSSGSGAACFSGWLACEEKRAGTMRSSSPVRLQ